MLGGTIPRGEPYHWGDHTTGRAERTGDRDHMYIFKKNIDFAIIVLPKQSGELPEGYIPLNHQSLPLNPIEFATKSH